MCKWQHMNILVINEKSEGGVQIALKMTICEEKICRSNVKQLNIKIRRISISNIPIGSV